MNLRNQASKKRAERLVAERDRAREIALWLAHYIEGLLAGPPSGETLVKWREAIGYGKSTDAG